MLTPVRSKHESRQDQGFAAIPNRNTGEVSHGVPAYSRQEEAGPLRAVRALLVLGVVELHSNGPKLQLRAFALRVA